MSRPDVLERLFGVIEARKAERPAGSYVVQLLDGGVEADKCVAARLILFRMAK